MLRFAHPTGDALAILTMIPGYLSHAIQRSHPRDAPQALDRPLARAMTTERRSGRPDPGLTAPPASC